MENRDRFADHEIIAEVATGDAAFPEAVLAKVTNPAALGAEEHPWVVWSVDLDGQRGDGYYCDTFDKAWWSLKERAKR
jgi:hypothetical protein